MGQGRGERPVRVWSRSGAVSLALHAAVAATIVVPHARDVLRGLPTPRDRRGGDVTFVELVTPRLVQPNPGVPGKAAASSSVAPTRRARVQGDRPLQRPRPAPTLVHQRRLRPIPPAEPQPSPTPASPPVEAMVASSLGPEQPVQIAASTPVSLAASSASTGAGAGPSRPALVPPSEAQVLRIEESFPDLPSSLRGRGGPLRAVVEVCVDRTGLVDGARLRQVSAPELDHALLEAVRTWRYRPRVVDGAATPFCHLMAFEYRRP